MSSVAFAFAGAAVVAVATAARVYRGGTTLNDHAVAAVVVGCVGLYPLLWWGASGAGADGPALATVLTAGCTSIYALFHVLDGRRDPGVLIWAARLSQPALAFALWAGLFLLLRTPYAWWSGAAWAWPGAALLLPLGLALWGSAWTWIGGRALRVVPAEVPGLPAPLTVVHLSDLHVGPTFRDAELAALLARVDALRPDLVVVTGDLVTPFSEREHAFLIERLPRLKAPVFVCFGNHDLPVADTLKAELESAGVRVLVDASVVVPVGTGTVEIVGVDFHWRDARGHLLSALAALPLPEAHLRLLLAHDPRLFTWVPDGRFDLVLSGHTHGGQVGTDMFGVPWSVLRPLGVYDQGEWRRGPNRLYVHRGNWNTGLPPRMGIAAEIVVHRFAPAATARQLSRPPQGA